MEEVKKGKKKNKVASLLLALALILTCGVAGTIAQYQKSFNGNATATVAKFNVSSDIDGQTVDLLKTVYDENGDPETDVLQDGSGNVIRMAPGTIGCVPIQVTNDSEVTVKYSFDLKKVGNVDTTTQASFGNAYLQKFTSGWSAEFKYTDSPSGTSTPENNTNVKADIPLKWYLYTPANGTTAPTNTQLAGFTYVDFDSVVATASSLNGKIAPTSTATSKTVYLCWQWEHKGTIQGLQTGIADDTNKDRLDTALGENATSLTPKLKITAKFTQED